MIQWRTQPGECQLPKDSRLMDGFRLRVCQVLSQQNLTIWRRWNRVKKMPRAAKTRSTASSIRLQIERGGEKFGGTTTSPITFSRRCPDALTPDPQRHTRTAEQGCLLSSSLDRLRAEPS